MKEDFMPPKALVIAVKRALRLPVTAIFRAQNSAGKFSYTIKRIA